MNKKTKNTTFISLISGKGGAGKTVLGLSIAKILSEVKFKVLFVDCDFSTHGASYFMEDELDPEMKYSSFVNILTYKSSNNILKTKEGFSFLPSTLDPVNTKEIIDTLGFNVTPSCFNEYDYVIFDCQAGYASLTEDLLRISNKNIIVLEADAVSSSALRVLYLQLSKLLGSKNTWQIFNKLTEEERKIYGNISDGTFFTNLPPVPFDWKVRGAFALGKIPGLFGKDSVFGIAVIRFLKIVLRERRDILANIEKEAVGDWYVEIINNIENLEIEKEKINQLSVNKKRKQYQNRMTYISIFIGVFSVSITFLFMYNLLDFLKFYGWIAMSISGVFASILIFWNSKKQMKQEKEKDKERIMINEIEKELDHYKTLLNTDDRLNEYVSEKYSTQHAI